MPGSKLHKHTHCIYYIAIAPSFEQLSIASYPCQLYKTRIPSPSSSGEIPCGFCPVPRERERETASTAAAAGSDGVRSQSSANYGIDCETGRGTWKELEDQISGSLGLDGDDGDYYEEEAWRSLFLISNGSYHAREFITLLKLPLLQNFLQENYTILFCPPSPASSLLFLFSSSSSSPTRSQQQHLYTGWKEGAPRLCVQLYLCDAGFTSEILKFLIAWNC